MVGQAASPTRTVYVDVTLTRSKVKVTALLKLPTISEAVHAGGDDRSPLTGLSDLKKFINCSYNFFKLRVDHILTQLEGMWLCHELCKNG